MWQSSSSLLASDGVVDAGPGDLQVDLQVLDPGVRDGRRECDSVAALHTEILRQGRDEGPSLNKPPLLLLLPLCSEQAEPAPQCDYSQRAHIQIFRWAMTTASASQALLRPRLPFTAASEGAKLAEPFGTPPPPCCVCALSTEQREGIKAY